MHRPALVPLIFLFCGCPRMDSVDMSAEGVGIGGACCKGNECAQGLACYGDVPCGECSRPCKSALDCGDAVCVSGRCRKACDADSDCRAAPFRCVDLPNGYCGTALPPPPSPPPDLNPVPDLAVPLLDPPDLAGPRDLFTPPDLVEPPDLFTHCRDRVQDEDETDVDCGGATCECCSERVQRLGCKVDADCCSPQDWGTGHSMEIVCSKGQCMPRCRDGVKDGDETDVDCGGSCTKVGPIEHTCWVLHDYGCKEGRGCKTSLDCAVGGTGGFGSCCLIGDCINGVCVDACRNGVQDHGETDVDCGIYGPFPACLISPFAISCDQCPDGKKCVQDGDCKKGRCSAGRCATISDGGARD